MYISSPILSLLSRACGVVSRAMLIRSESRQKLTTVDVRHNNGPIFQFCWMETQGFQIVISFIVRLGLLAVDSVAVGLRTFDCCGPGFESR